MALTFVLVCSFLFFLYQYRTGGGRRKAIVLGVLLGLAMLAKGPLGLVLPGFTFLTFLIMKRDLGFLKRLHPFTIFTMCAIVAGSWYLLALWQGGKPFLSMVLKENFGTVVGQEAGHPHPFWWYIPYLFQNMAPWSLFFPTLAVFLYRYQDRLAKEEVLYVVIWLSTVIIFFSVFSQKRTVYILSAYPAIALLFGAWWHNLKREDVSAEPLLITRLAAYLNAGSFLILALLLILQFTTHAPLSYLVPMLDEKDQLDMIRVAGLLSDHRVVSLVWAALCGVGGLFLILAVKRNAWGAFIACTAVLMALSLNNVQSFDTELAKQYTMKPFMRRVVALVKNEPLYFYDSEDYATMFYAGRHIHAFRSEQSVPPFCYVLFWENEWQSMRGREGLIVEAISESADRVSPKRGHLMLVAVRDAHALAAARPALGTTGNDPARRGLGCSALA
jgi:4-amino-4-deoxy-L-arabinose transferase-like glycosyltransferase